MREPTNRYEAPLQLPMAFHEAIQRYSKVNTRDVSAVVEPEGATGKPSPFLKWVGGKRSLIEELKNRMPASFKDYYEPFIGGGALFFEVSDKLKKAHLSDMNFDLIMAYKVVQKDVHKLIERLRQHVKNHNEKYYYEVRCSHDLKDPIEIAARAIYLNKTCYNGLWRVNKKGEFNVPMGSYSNPTVFQKDNLLLCNKALRSVDIEYRDYTTISPQKDDFVYFDPPYHPTDEGNFTKYSKLDFTEKDQSNLVELCADLHKSGVKVMVSNSNTKYIRELYKSSVFKTQIVNAPRMVNCKPNGRSAVEEVLITNY